MNQRTSFIARLINKFHRLYWWAVRPETTGVKVLLFDDNNKILMVRLSYYPDNWTFPGGGVGKNEDTQEAARRECGEEVGLTPKKLEPSGSLSFTHEYKKDTVFVFTGRTEGAPELTIDNKEVIEAGWFSLDNLPSMGPNAKKMLNVATKTT